MSEAGLVGGSQQDREQILKLHADYIDANARFDRQMLDPIWSKAPEALFFNLNGHTYKGRDHWFRLWEFYGKNAELARTLDLIRDGAFSPGERNLFKPLIYSLRADRYFVLADYASYVACQERAADTYRDTATWTRKSILNVARVGRFSSDRTIRQYAEEIWNIDRVRL